MHYSPLPDSPARPEVLPRMRWTTRLVLATFGIGLLGLLATAAWLAPSPQGFGTHQQLGLPACTIVQWYGVRCPSCGMTTSWSHLMHGKPTAALRANVGGVLLAIVALACGPWLVTSGFAGRWVVGPPREIMVVVIGLAIVVVTLIDWTIRLSLGG